MNEDDLACGHYLLRPLNQLAGYNPYILKRLEVLVGSRYADLLFHWPVQIRERYYLINLSSASFPCHVTLRLRMIKHCPGIPYRITACDETGIAHLTFFRGQPALLKRLFTIGNTYVVQGWLEFFKGEWQIAHPTIKSDRAWLRPGCHIEPVYSLIAGITEKCLKSMIQRVLAAMPDHQGFFVDYDSESLTWKQALIAIHHPQTVSDLEPLAPARQRLYKDEILAQQCALKRMRSLYKKDHAISFPLNISWREQCLGVLPFILTLEQTHILSEIDHDMAQPQRMMRLIQGDVGSGKTVLAFLALAHVVQAGYQGFLMAPTESLARQHFKTLRGWGTALEISVLFITAQEKTRDRKKTLAHIASGAPCIVIGTHALLEESVMSPCLGLIVVDEQHRFGVHQRLKLIEKNPKAHFLMLSATPIPRTLQLSLQRDLDISSLREKPIGRQPIQTIAVPHKKINLLYGRLSQWLSENYKIYWICPLIETSETLDHLTPCEERYADLNHRYPGLVGMVHGRFSSESKQDSLERFIEGSFKLLIATTVIEVGIHVPDARVIVIEHAERFGLSQLHQLRGRVGRGEHPGLCILLYSSLTFEAQERLNIMRQTSDGFEIAEKDLLLRGPGELFGLRQAGEQLMKLGLPMPPLDLLEQQEKLASLLLDDSSCHKKIDLLLKIFLRNFSPLSILQ